MKKGKYTVLGSGIFLLILIGWFGVVTILTALVAVFTAMPSYLTHGQISLSTYGMYAVTGAAELLLGVPLIVFMAVRKISPRALLGNRTNVRQNLFAALFGVLLVPALVGLESLITVLFGAVGIHAPDSSYMNPNSLGEMFAGFLAIGVTAGLVEEPIFRGLAMRGLGSAMGKRAAVLVSAVVFSLFHMDAVGFLERFLIGVMLGYMAWRAGALLPGMFAHAAFNSTAVGLGFLMNTALKGWNGFFFWLSADMNGVFSMLLISIPFAAAAWGVYRLFARATPASAAWVDRPYAKSDTRPAHAWGWIAAGALLAVITAAVTWFTASGLMNNFKV